MQTPCEPIDVLLLVVLDLSTRSAIVMNQKSKFVDFPGPWALRESGSVWVGGSCRYCWVLKITFRRDVTLSRAACIVASSIFAVLAFSAGILPLVWAMRGCRGWQGAGYKKFAQ